MIKKSTYFKTATLLLSANLLFACSNDDITGTVSGSETEASATADAAANEELNVQISEVVSYDSEDEYSEWEDDNPVYIDLSGTAADFDSTAAVLLQDGVLTIKTGGTYVLSGDWTGQVTVNAEDKNTVRLVLNGVELSSSDSAAINVVNAEKTMISLVEGTTNTVSDGEEYVFEDASEDEPNAAIFSKSDLIINGAGQLTVNANYNNGIASKDELRITGGDISVTAVDDALIGRDLVAMNNGALTIDAGGDGMKTTNDEDATKGNIALEGGTFAITAGNDGMQAITSLMISNGDYMITSGGGSPETVEGNGGQMKGFGQGSAEATVSNNTESDSAKGLKAGTALTVSGGTFEVDSSDDAMHSNGSITVAGGDWTLSSGDDGIHSDTAVVIKGGNLNIAKSYEGIEGQNITIDNGNVHVTASDDGVNVAGGADGSGEEMQGASAGMLTINGGYLWMNADGDGLDSNGSVAMTAGTVIVNGPVTNGNGSLDYSGTFDMSGGFLIAAGSSGMVQAISEESAQSGIVMTYSASQAADTVVHLEDSEGNDVVTFAPAKDYQSVFISSPELAANASYTLYAGGSSTGANTDGLYADGTYENGTEVVEFTISEPVTWLNESGVTEASSGMGGRGGGGNLERPDGGMFGGLDEETQEKAQAIMEQMQAGTITREEAQAQLADLGIEFGRKD